jgi:hypothetical protein
LDYIAIIKTKVKHLKDSLNIQKLLLLAEHRDIPLQIRIEILEPFIAVAIDNLLREKFQFVNVDIADGRWALLKLHSKHLV